MLKHRLQFIIFLLFPTSALAQVLTWSPVTTDTGGNSINPSAIYYKLYYNLGSPPFLYASDHDAAYIDLQYAPEGCYNLRVTAVRTDSSPELESSPSDAVYACVGGPVSEITIPATPENLSYD